MKLSTIKTKFGEVPGLGVSEQVQLGAKTGYSSAKVLFSDWKNKWLYLAIPVVVGVAAAKVFNLGHTLYKRTQMRSAAAAR